MLVSLRVRQLAIIEEVEVAFGPGLNVVTGETGAGKSILVAALGLVLGGRGRPELVRTGADRTEVEALFDITDLPAVRPRLAELGWTEEELRDDTELTIRRVVELEGRSRAWVNGRITTMAQLQRLAAGLVDISSQHEHHSLVDAATHLGYLDAYARLDEERRAMGEAFARWREAAAKIEDLRTRIREGREELLRFQLAEIDPVLAAAVDEAELTRLRNAGQLGQAVRRVEDVLQARDGAVTTVLARARVELEQAARLDPELSPRLAQLEGALAEIEDLARELGRYARLVHADPARLAAMEEALHEARRVRRKFGEDLVKVRAEIAAELAALEGAQDTLAELDERRARSEREATERAAALSTRRRQEAQRLGDAIAAELASLAMGEARVQVEVADGGLTATGLDKVEFLIATNRGEAPRPLRKVASGGELSRALLAVKRVLAQLGPVGLYVFDEVDSGVGGAVAETIGAKIADVARHHQVLCITHLPQIAAFADLHFHVHKLAEGERTRSHVRRLDEAGHLDELARMIGGVTVTPAARDAARALLSAARGG